MHYGDAQVEITRVVVGPLDNNVHVIRCVETSEAVLLDAADEPELLLALCRDLGVRGVLQTHGHRDHIGAVPALRAAGYPVLVGAGDASRLPGYDGLLVDDQVLDVGQLRLRALHTPGHTPGSMSFAVEGSLVVFSGDTLFPGGPGATRSPDSDFDAIIASVERLLGFEDDTVVMPGHGADTTVGTERPHLPSWIERGW